MKIRILLLVLFPTFILASQHEQFLSTKFNEINVRVGPSKIYPVKLVYKKKLLPVKVIAEYEDWKQVQDIDGDGGWIHISTLSKNRTILCKKEKIIYRQASIKSVVIAKAEKGFICKLKKYQGGWCKVQCDTVRGWMQSSDLWGLYKNELTAK